MKKPLLSLAVSTRLISGFHVAIMAIIAYQHGVGG
ncbi:hypothetical protein BRLA_c005640 [Brevibacillus laterosporus LMG 15441]|uniref:Uncharacterized protein n=1 Tax=Brevibacillus laterosporus LMG 15441 TaxID=1042163 RepID=A0A075QWZ0_BRELA|nr:hypothetical protein BRLA_c005640 [Brevibacillus laterosporus LMG 15441]